jgi:hypothetical protein
VYLNAHGARLVLSGAHLVQTEHLARGVVELVMVDLDVCECCIELYVDVALPRRKLEGSHGERVAGCLDVCWWMKQYAVRRNYVFKACFRVTGPSKE